MEEKKEGKGKEKKMEEKKEAQQKEKIVPQRADSLEFAKFCLKRAEDFDKITFKEARECFLQGISPDWYPDWLAEHVEAYLEIDDFETVFMLLRTMANARHDIEKKAVALMVKTTEKILVNSPCYPSFLKDALVILCGKLNFEGSLYNEDVRAVFEKIIKKFYPGIYGSSEEEARLISRVLFVIGHVKDKYFLPLLEAKDDFSPEHLSHLMEYTSVCKDQLAMEGLRLLVIKYLEK